MPEKSIGKKKRGKTTAVLYLEKAVVPAEKPGSGALITAEKEQYKANDWVRREKFPKADGRPG